MSEHRLIYAANHGAWATALVLLSALGCTEKSNPSANVAGTPGVMGSDTAGSSAPAAGASAGAAGTTAGTAGTTGGMTAGAGGVGAPQAGAGGVAPQMDGGAADSAAEDGAVDSMVPIEIPAPVTEPYVWGFGLGVTDLPAAVDFYTTVMEVTVEKEVTRSALGFSVSDLAASRSFYSTGLGMDEASVGTFPVTDARAPAPSRNTRRGTPRARESFSRLGVQNATPRTTRSRSCCSFPTLKRRPMRWSLRVARSSSRRHAPRSTTIGC